MQIGIGITTYNRPECLKECLDNIYEHTGINKIMVAGNERAEPLGFFHGHVGAYELSIYVAYDTDEDRQGVAKRKNECLRALKGCDYVFLFDEDCHPAKDGWIDFFVNSGFNHLLYLKEQHNPFIHCGDGSTVYQNCGGVFMFMTKKAIDAVGAFNEEFELYGFEHADYSKRIAIALGEHFNYRSLDRTSEYIFAHDYSTTGHKSSISDEEKQKHIKNNWNKFFSNATKSIYLQL